MRQIRVFDTTLRDGEKSPGTILTLPEKVRLAQRLERLDVDVLEAGFPAASRQQFEAVERIAAAVRGPVVAVLARATNPRDFDIAWEAVKGAERPRLHTFVPVSAHYRNHFLKKSFDETLELAATAVKAARKFTGDVEFSMVDAMRAPVEDVVKMVKAAVGAGATTVNIADTVGYATPREMDTLIRKILEATDGLDGVTLSIHCHNDLGLALANSLAAVEAGANQVHCTLNGIGERAGNTPLEELAAVLHARSAAIGARTGLAMEQICSASRLARQLTGVGVQPHKPVVGTNAFVFEMMVPQLADAKEKPPYEVISPETVGARMDGDVLSATTSLEEFESRVAELGYDIDRETLTEAYQDFQELAARKEKVFDADLDSILNFRNAKDLYRYRLRYLNVSAGSISVPNATVQLEVDGEVRQDAGFGHGPVDATFKTICKMVKRFPKLIRYEVSAATAGTDAQGEVTVRMEEEGRLVQGRGVDTDIVLASAKAFVDGLNKLEFTRRERPVSEFTDEESLLPRL